MSQLVAPAAAGPNLYQKMGGETTLGSSFQQKRFASQLETQQVSSCSRKRECACVCV